MEISLAIKIQPESIGNEYVSAGEIVRKHIEILGKKGKVYFSTNLQVDKKRISSIHTLAIYNVNEDIYYLADVDTARVGVSADFLPEDAKEFSPVKYGTEYARTWFLLSKIEKIEESDLEGYYVLGDPDTSVVEKMRQTSRFPRFYFTK